MADLAELGRLAAAWSILRPEWPEKSIRTRLIDHHAARPYWDLLVATAVCWGDPATDLPARLGEHGPWWAIVAALNRADAARAPVRAADECPDHPGWPADACGGHRADTLAGDTR